MSDYIVGLTGGVASGKSAVAARFERLGVFISDADHAARQVLATNSPGLAEVVVAFGPEVLDHTGRLDRPAMRQRIFADPAARRTLEAIVHPRIRALMQAECQAAETVYAIAVIPLLAETGRVAYPWLQRVLLVDTTVELQRVRLLGRDGINPALAEQMIATQANREQRWQVADDIIFNDGPLDVLEAPIAALDADYRAFGQRLPALAFSSP